MIKTDLWEMIERERRAQEYIEYCALRRFKRKFSIAMAIVSILGVVMLVIIN